MDTNTGNIARSIARVMVAADRAGLPSAATTDLWSIRHLTRAGQLEALSRWERCIETWPSPTPPRRGV